MNQESFIVADMKGTLSKNLSQLGSPTTCCTFSIQQGKRCLMQKFCLKSLLGAKDFLLTFVGQIPWVLIRSNFASAKQDFLILLFIFCDLISFGFALSPSLLSSLPPLFSTCPIQNVIPPQQKSL